jgi:hypothetical protein
MCQSGHCSSSGAGSRGVCCSYDCCDDSTAHCPDLDCDMMDMMMDACGN